MEGPLSVYLPWRHELQEAGLSVPLPSVIPALSTVAGTKIYCGPVCDLLQSVTSLALFPPSIKQRVWTEEHSLAKLSKNSEFGL